MVVASLARVERSSEPHVHVHGGCWIEAALECNAQSPSRLHQPTMLYYAPLHGGANETKPLEVVDDVTLGSTQVQSRRDGLGRFVLPWEVAIAGFRPQVPKWAPDSPSLVPKSGLRPRHS